jgi:exo-1,4-beta-D-glucosaminidase
MAEYADFTDLNNLPKVKIDIENSLKNDGEEYELSVKLKNPGNKIAFLIELGMVGDKSGKSIVPVIWDENYISLVPGESKVIKARFTATSLMGEKPVFSYKGWNLE